MPPLIPDIHKPANYPNPPVEPIPAPEPEPEPVPEPEPEPEPIPEPEPEPEPQPVDTIESIGEGADLGKGGYDVPVPYQRNRFAIGLRTGFASTLNKVDGKIPVGMDLALDLRYGHYWAAKKDAVAIGFQTGLGLNYVMAKHHTTLDTGRFPVATSEGNVDYHVTAERVNETTNQLILEIPVFFSHSNHH